MLKVLIVTYYWPPSAGGGVQRWLKMAEHLPEFGVEPIIFTPENPAFGLRDTSLVNEIPANLEVWKFPIWEPFKLLGKGSQPLQGQVLEKRKKSILDKLLIFLRATFFIPDPRVFWVDSSVKFLLPMLKSNGINIVITTGPPHSMHLIGLQLKKKAGVRWVADFRDPWSKWDILDKLGVKGWAKKRHEAMEQKVLKNADLLITVSESWAEDFRSLGATKTFVLTNGFDKEAFAERRNKKNGRFVVSHIGMLNEMRNPLALWQALAQLCRESLSFSSELEIYLAGIPSEHVATAIRAFPELRDKLVVDGYLSHASAIRAMQASDILLLVTNESHNARGHIPGKLFEYLAAGKPILAVGDPEGDTAKILKETGAGRCYRFGDLDPIKGEVLKRYNDNKKGSSFNPRGVDQYSRRTLAMKLAIKLQDLGKAAG